MSLSSHNMLRNKTPEGELVKAADIPDTDFVAAVAYIQSVSTVPANRWAVAAYLSTGPSGLDLKTCPGAAIRIPDLDTSAFPDKVVLAKAKRLIKRKMIEGCACGCRGDFKISNQTTEGAL